MKPIFIQLTTTTVGTALFWAIFTNSIPAQAASYNLSWTGDNGYTMTGMFGFDDQFLGTTVTRDELDFMMLSFFDPQKNLLQSFNYSFPQTGEFNFNFDTNTETVLQSEIAFETEGFDLGIDNSSGTQAGIDFYTCFGDFFDTPGICPFSPLGEGIILQQNDVPGACFVPSDPNCQDLDGGGVVVATRKVVPEPTSLIALLVAGIAGFLTQKKLTFSAKD